MKKVCLPVLLSSVLFIFHSCFPPPPPQKKKAFNIEVYARQFRWTACYTGDDSIFGKTNYRMYAETNPLWKDTTDPNSADDFYVTHELHVPKDRDVQFYFRSRDVIHSAFMPQFRCQMNAVPGMTTTFKIQSAYFCEYEKAPVAELWLMCNKICGAGHYNMKIKLVIDSEADFKKWWSAHKTIRH